MWRCRRACYVHYTVNTCVVAGERLTDVEVGKTYTRKGVERIEVDCRRVGVAAEVDCTSLLEQKIALQEVLDGESVMSGIYGVVAKHVEVAFVEIVGFYHSVAVERDIVARPVVHQQAYCNIWRAVYKEVYVHVGRDVHRFVGCWQRNGGGVVGRRLLAFLPCKEVLRRNSIGRRHIIDNGATRLWRAVDIDVYLSASSADFAIACNEGCTVERVAVEGMGVVC